MRGPCRSFIGDNKGRLRVVVAAEEPWVQDMEPLWKRIEGHFSVGNSHGKFVVEEKLEVGLWRLNVRFECFICAVV
jgi:hypothetical protein